MCNDIQGLFHIQPTARQVFLAVDITYHLTHCYKMYGKNFIISVLRVFI